MECYYVDEVIEQIDEEIQFFQEQIKDRGPEVKFTIPIAVLEHIKAKMKRLTIKYFNYGL